MGKAISMSYGKESIKNDLPRDLVPLSPVGLGGSNVSSLEVFKCYRMTTKYYKLKHKNGLTKDGFNLIWSIGQ